MARTTKEQDQEFFANMRKNSEPAVLDFFRGMRFIRGWNAAETARKRQILSTEAGRLEMIRQRELNDKLPPEGPMTA
jgi:hypothetical protein